MMILMIIIMIIMIMTMPIIVIMITRRQRQHRGSSRAAAPRGHVARPGAHGIPLGFTLGPLGAHWDPQVATPYKTPATLTYLDIP